MERLKAMKETLMSCIEGQLGKLEETDTKELGEAIDMIKDLEEAMYYCSIVKAMEKTEKEEELMNKIGLRNYSSRYLPERDMDRDMGRMYYSERQPRNDRGEFMPYSDRRNYGEGGGNSSGGNSSSSGSSGARVYYTERQMPFDMRDMREGRSGMSRRNYMEAKEMHKDQASKMQDLEKYMQELGSDIVEMIEDASPEEKAMLEKKLNTLTTKVHQLNV